MKNKKKKKRIAPAFRSFYPILIMVLCLFMSVGYAAVNSVNLTIDGDILAMEQDGVVVTGIVFKEGVGSSADLSNISVVSNTLLNGNVVLSSSNVSSYIIYTISVLNTNDYDCFFNGAIFDSGFYDNENIIFELSNNMLEGMFLKSGESLSFDIKFKYKENVIPNSSINKLNAYINVDFPAVAMLKPTSETDVSGFRAYKEKIKNITFENKIDVPDDAQSWDIGVSETGDVMAYLVTNESDSNYYDLYIQSDTQLYANENMGWWFSNFEYVDTINNLKMLDTSKVTSMSRLFSKTGKSSTSFTLDVSNFDTSNVVDMSYMFYYTGYNSTLFTLDVSNFDTSNVTNMSCMFHNTGFFSTSLTFLDLSNFDTSNVTDMRGMFIYIAAASKNFTLDVSNFDTSNVTDMSYMFYYSGYSNPNFTLDVSNFDTSKVTDMNSMFYKTGYDSSVFTMDVSNFDTSEVTDMYRTFYYIGYNSTKLVTSITISNPNVTSFDNMFLNAVPLSGSKFTVNYTSETSDLVDNMIATKADVSNVVKGSLIQ